MPGYRVRYRRPRAPSGLGEAGHVSELDREPEQIARLSLTKQRLEVAQIVPAPSGRASYPWLRSGSMDASRRRKARHRRSALSRQHSGQSARVVHGKGVEQTIERVDGMQRQDGPLRVTGFCESIT